MSTFMVESKSIVPVRIFSGAFMGSMNMPGFSLSLTNFSNISSETSTPTATLLRLIDAPHTSPAWPATQNIYPVPEALKGRKRADQFTEVEKEEKKVDIGGPKLLSELNLDTACWRVSADGID